MNFFRENPEFLKNLAVIGCEYLGFIEVVDSRFDDETYRKAHALLDSIGRTFMMLMIIVIEMKLAEFIVN